MDSVADRPIVAQLHHIQVEEHPPPGVLAVEDGPPRFEMRQPTDYTSAWGGRYGFSSDCAVTAIQLMGGNNTRVWCPFSF